MRYLRSFVIFFGTTGRFCAFFSPQGLCFAAAYKVIAYKSCGDYLEYICFAPFINQNQ